jgi:phosphatidylethanolamine-binding protein
MLFSIVSALLLAGTTAFAQTTPEGFTPSTNATLDVYYGSTYVTPGLMIKKSGMGCRVFWW